MSDPEAESAGLSADHARRRAFMAVHSGLPREGPGNRDATARALALGGALPDRPRVLDLGCGPGQQTLDLAELLPGADVTCIDLHPPFVDEANARFAAAGVAERVRARVGDMLAVDAPPGSIDLIWCEGAAYGVGVSRALATWRSWLAAAGRVAFTDAVWLEPDPPAELLAWWRSGYPEMLDRAGQIERVEALGYRLLGEFVLPEAAWWDDYYRPLENRIGMLRESWQADPIGCAVLDECSHEIDLYRRYARYYGYQFVVAGC